MPLSSLRSKRGVGTVREGQLFLEWLARTGQNAWQLLPLSQTHLEPGSASVRVPSPYKGYGIGLDPRYLDDEWAAIQPTAEELAEFCRRESYWLDTYAAFAALSGHFGTDDWSLWPDERLRRHEMEVVNDWTAEHRESAEAVILEQWQLNQAFRNLKSRAESLGIELIGDLPFYIPKQSPLVWANQECFDLESDGSTQRVSGIPQSLRSHFGRQTWGHPLYVWNRPEVADRIVDLWKRRIRHSAEFFDIARLDHAKGFFRYGSIDVTDSKLDTVCNGPGEQFLISLVGYTNSLGLKVFAENSGDRIAAMVRVLKRIGTPGITIIRFGYNEKKGEFNPHHGKAQEYPQNSFAYTTTHDTITLIDYAARLSPKEITVLCEAASLPLPADPIRLAVALRQAVIESPSRYSIIPLQDWFLWPDRINIPGTEKAVGDRNWRWVMPVPIEDLPTDLPTGTP